MLRTYSELRTCNLMETNATYPGGHKQRHTITSRYCLSCTSCDPSRKQEVCISDYCVHLGDRAVFIFSDNGTLRKTLPLNPLTCPPRYLHPSTVSENLIFIVCHPTSAGQSQYLELDDYTEQFPAPTTVSGSSLIFAKGYNAHDEPSNFILYLSDNRIILEMLYDSAPPRPLSSPPECDTLTMLHPRAAKGNEIQFWLDCTTESNVTKRFNMIADSTSPVTELYDTTGVPTDSPNGNYVTIRHNNSLTIYNTSNLQQYPGMKTFAGRIQQIDFLSADQLLVVVPGQNHTLVDIPVFVRSDGTRGVAELPGTIAYCPTGGSCLPHKLIDRDTLLVFTRNGNVYKALFYTTSDPIQCLGAVRRIRDRPQVAFFNSQPAVNTTPAPNSTSSSGTSPTPERTEPITSPTSSPPTLPPTSSSPPTLRHSSPPTVSSEVKSNATTPPTNTTTKGDFTILIIVVAVMIPAFLAAVGCIVFFYVCRQKMKSPTNEPEYKKKEEMVTPHEQGEESGPRRLPTGGPSSQEQCPQIALTLLTTSDQTSEYSSAGSSPMPSSYHLQPQASISRPGSSCSLTTSSGVSGSERTSLCDGASVQGEAVVPTHTDTAHEQSHTIKYAAQVKNEMVIGQNTRLQ